MKRKLRNLLIVLLVFILSGCNSEDSYYQTFKNEALIKVSKPTVVKDITGVWELTSSQVFDEKNESTISNSKSNTKEIFISDTVFEYKDLKILNPTITARYVKLISYFTSKGMQNPVSLNLKDENVVVYKFRDNKLMSQDLVQLSDGQLIIFKKDGVETYKKKHEITKKEEKEHYDTLLSSIEGNGYGADSLEYAVSIAVRNSKYKNVGETLDYNYKTYFISKQKKDNNAKAVTVKDIVFSIDNVLWSVEHSRSLSNEESPQIVDKISANPIFREEAEKVNFLQEKVTRRIDYVNDDYIAMTYKNEALDTRHELYEIQNLNQLSKNQPLKVNNIAGAEGLDTFNSVVQDTVSIVANQTDTILEYKKNTTNVGIKRERMSWSFVSNFEARLADDGKTVYRSIPLQLIPIINIASFDNKNINWNDVVSRVPDAINAVVAPDGDSIIILTNNKLSLYSIYNNFISLDPQITIIIENGAEIVMSKWYPKDNISATYEEYQKLPRINTQLIYQ